MIVLVLMIGGWIGWVVRNTQIQRDWSVAEVVLGDLTSRRDSPIESIPGRPMVLFSEESPVQKITAEEVLQRQDAEAWERLSRVELELAREADDDLVRRSRKEAPFRRFRSSDNRIRVLDKQRTADARRVQFPERPELVHAYPPGYSRDRRIAVLRLTFTKDRHGGIGTYVLARENGRWVIRLRDFRCFF